MWRHAVVVNAQLYSHICLICERSSDEEQEETKTQTQEVTSSVSVPSPDKWGDFVSKGTWNKINQTCGSILCGDQLRVACIF